MKQVFCKAGYVALKVCQQVHDLRDDFMEERELKALATDSTKCCRLGFSQDVKQSRTRSRGARLVFEEAHRARRGPGLRVAGGSEADCRDQTVPRWRQEFAEQKDNGRSDPAPRRWTSYHSRGEAVQQDTGISIQASSGRFDRCSSA